MFCAANPSFAVSVVMFKQLTRVGIQIKDLDLCIVAPRNLFSEFMLEYEARRYSPLRERRKSLKFIKDFKRARSRVTNTVLAGGQQYGPRGSPAGLF